MSNIDAFYPTQFMTNYDQVLQQMESRLLGSVVRADFTGKEKKFNLITTRAMTRVTTRKGDTEDGDFDGTNYWLRQLPYNKVTIFDEFDEHYLGQIVLPTSDEVKAHAMAANRTTDDVIIAAFDATRNIGSDGTTTDAFPSSQNVAVTYQTDGTSANCGLTVGKLRQAKYLMDVAEVPEGDRYIAVGAKQLQDLLSTTEVTNTDYASVAALVKGQVDQFLGFKFINSQRLPRNTSTDVRTVFAWHKEAVKFAMGERKVKMDVRADKNHALQIRTVAMMGAVRTQNELVVRIYCDESP